MRPRGTALDSFAAVLAVLCVSVILLLPAGDKRPQTPVWRPRSPELLWLRIGELGAMGDAGACVTNNMELNHKIRLISNHGQDTKYEHKIVGYNYRLDSIQAAILSVKLKYLSEWTARISEIANLFSEKLTITGLKLPIEVEGRKHAWHQYVIRTSKRDELAKSLAESGIATAIHYPIPLHLQPSFQYLGYKNGDFPVSENCASEVLSLPLYPELSDDDVELICSEVILNCEKLNI